MKKGKKSPLKAKPLRNPGQSVEERYNTLFYDKILTPAVFVMVFVILAFFEWTSYLREIPRNPVLYTVMALLAVIYFAVQVYRYLPELRQLRLGQDGEKAVGQYLERLRESGYQVFHDIISQDGNIDHVLIGPAGVFTIETKTWSKPVRGKAVITFDGERIFANGYELERDPVGQAKAQAAWLKDQLSESTGKEFKVRPVIVFPSWFIKPDKNITPELWILEPKALLKILRKQNDLLLSEDVNLAGYHLSRIIRCSESVV
ncbi:MAG: nuclease-related domain-containing protein [Methylococcales bacterium]